MFTNLIIIIQNNPLQFKQVHIINNFMFNIIQIQCKILLLLLRMNRIIAMFISMPLISF